MSGYRINKTGMQKWVRGEGWKWIDANDYDIIVERVGSGYATAYYEILKNSPGLSPEELADICDPCNFGYRIEGNKLVIYTD